jgi:hypothetical protein
MKIPLLVRMSRQLLQKLQRRYGMPDLSNAFDELVARSLTMESAKQVRSLSPTIQTADLAKEYYDLDPNWNNSSMMPEFKLRFSLSVLSQLAQTRPFKTACKNHDEVFRLMLERGLWGESTDDAKPQYVKGFGDIGGVLPISSKDAEDKLDVVLL